MLENVDAIRSRMERVLDRIAAAARKGGRGPESVRVVVVTKLQPLEMVKEAIEAGARILGENYPEEAAGKIAMLSRQSGVEWHMIGHIQSRKAQLVPSYFDLVHSLDSLKLAGRLDRFAAEAGRNLPVLLEFNVSGEPSKHGWQAADEGHWADLLSDMNAIAALSNLKVRGLMTMPPLTEDPEEARAFFQRLRRLRDFLKQEVPQGQWDELSMGTSADFAVAVEEGATLVRVGQAILGPRPKAEGE